MGKDQGKLMYPCSLKIDESGDIYIVDEGMSISSYYSYM